jgi:hypothetical protein
MGLQSKTRAHDVVQSRQKRVIRAKQTSVSGGGVCEFDLVSNSEWFDLNTARLVFDLTVPNDASGNPIMPKGGGWWCLFNTPEIVIKGQSCTDGQTNVDIYNAMRYRLEKAQAGAYSYDQVDSGVWGGGWGSNFIYSNAVNRISGANMIYTVAMPLSYVVEMMSMERSYLPAYALPINLRLQLNSLSRAFACRDGVTGAFPTSNYSLSNLAIEVDGLMMSPEIDDAFRSLVASGEVSFYYPHTFTQTQSIGDSAGNVIIKTNQVATCMNRALIHIHPTVDATQNTTVPYVTQAKLGDIKTMKFGGFNAYIDSRNIYSEPIKSYASLYGELKRATDNLNNKEREDAPQITAEAWLNESKLELGQTNDLRDQALCVVPCAMKRELVKDSVSGINLSLTGGNCLFEITNIGATGTGSGREASLFLSSTRQIVLSKDFLFVRR